MKTESSTASGGRRRYAAAPLAEINIIPLVDVTLVILIIFMVATTFEKPERKTPPPPPQPELPVVLPYSAAALPPAQAAAPLVIGIDRGGRKYIGETPATTETLHQHLREVAERDPKQRIRIDADRDTRYEEVVEVVELCQFEGLHNVGLHCSNRNQ